MGSSGFLVLESGEVFHGTWVGGENRAGEVVFNTSHSGYEEMATDPSYFSQILVMTAPMQGNYGINDLFWESSQFWIQGFVCLDMQGSKRDSSWARRLKEFQIPTMDEVDTRALTLTLREMGTPWGALVKANEVKEAQKKAFELIAEKKAQDSDWVYQVSRRQRQSFVGENEAGPRVAILDLGCKSNIIHELVKRCREVEVFPSRTAAQEIRDWNPDGIMLSNGPGDPADVKMAVDTVKDLLGWRHIFGICMGHQILSLALGAKTYRLKFGHRGANHPIKDEILDRVYMTSQNHGYAVDRESLPVGVKSTHTNLNDHTVAGIQSLTKKCLSVQFHPESRPGPHDAETLFDYFLKHIQ